MGDGDVTPRRERVTHGAHEPVGVRVVGEEVEQGDDQDPDRPAEIEQPPDVRVTQQLLRPTGVRLHGRSRGVVC